MPSVCCLKSRSLHLNSPYVSLPGFISPAALIDSFFFCILLFFVFSFDVFFLFFFPHFFSFFFLLYFNVVPRFLVLLSGFFLSPSLYFCVALFLAFYYAYSLPPSLRSFLFILAYYYLYSLSLRLYSSVFILVFCFQISSLYFDLPGSSRLSPSFHHSVLHALTLPHPPSPCLTQHHSFTLSPLMRPSTQYHTISPCLPHSTPLSRLSSGLTKRHSLTLFHLFHPASLYFTPYSSSPYINTSYSASPCQVMFHPFSLYVKLSPLTSPCVTLCQPIKHTSCSPLPAFLSLILSHIISVNFALFHSTSPSLISSLPALSYLTLS